MYNEWFPLCYQANDHGAISRFHKAGRFTVSLPWPVANRDVFFVGCGVDDLTENRRLLIAAKSAAVGGEPVHPAVRFEPPPSGTVRAEMTNSGFCLEMSSPTTTVVTFVMRVDPKLAYVATSLLNFVMEKMVWVLLTQMTKAAQASCKPGSSYAKRRESNPAVYAYLDSRYHEVVAQHFGQPAM